MNIPRTLRFIPIFYLQVDTNVLPSATQHSAYSTQRMLARVKRKGLRKYTNAVDAQQKKYSVSPPLPKFSNKTMIYLQNNGTPRAYPTKSIISNEIYDIQQHRSEERERKKNDVWCVFQIFLRPSKKTLPTLQFNGKLTLIVKYFLRI